MSCGNLSRSVPCLFNGGRRGRESGESSELGVLSDNNNHTSSRHIKIKAKNYHLILS
jgi:hypothetical protein